MADDDKKKRDDQAPSLPSSGVTMATFAGVGTAVHLAKNKGEDRPLKAIRRAEEMRVKGAKRTEIHRETSKMLEGTPYAGVTYGADKQPRFEIDDSTASARVAGVPKGGKAFLTDALHHPDLYNAVPSAKHLTVQRSPTNDSGITGSGIVVGDKHFGGSIAGREIMKKSAKGPMLHEIQHHIQDIEGFAEGGTPSDFAKDYPNNPAKQKLAYTTLAGEQEAEMTRKRADMTAAERRAIMPQPDVPYEHQIVRFDARTKAKIDMTSVTDSARAAFRTLMNRDVADGKTIRFRKVDPSAVQSDAQTFQFKSGGDAAGVTDRLKGVKTWDPVAAGKTVIWERADGQMFIGDGHQRLGLAKRLQGAGQNVELDAYVMREKDGWSPRDVRAYAAVKNMKEGSGTSLDMAKVVRERPDLINDSLPLSDGKVRDAIALSKLSPEAFNMVVGGVIKPEHAAAVGSAVGDTTRHAGLLAEMAKAEVGSAQQARLYVGQAMAAGTYQETTGSLFGEQTETRSLLAERTKVLDKAIQSLKSDKKIFGLLEREAGQIEAAGNKLAHETNAARAEGAGRTAEIVERLALNRGPVSEMLDRAATAVAQGKTPSVAAREFVRGVHDTLKAGGMSALTGEAPKPAPAPVDPNQVNMFGGTGERPGWSDAAREASAEVRGEKAKGKAPRAKKEPRTKAMVDTPAPKETFQEMVARTREIHDSAEKTIRAEIAKPNPKLVVDQSKYGLKHVLTKQPAGDGFRITTFDAQGTPLGHMEYANDERGIRNMRQDMVSHGLGKKSKAMMDSELPPRKPVKTTPEAAAKWERELRAVPQDAAEKRLLERKKGERIGQSSRTKAMADDDMFGGPSTKDKIAAAARAKEAKGRTGDPMDVGLFGSSKDQTDLVDMAKTKPAVTKESIVAAHKKGMARIEAKQARADRKGKKAGAERAAAKELTQGQKWGAAFAKGQDKKPAEGGHSVTWQTNGGPQTIKGLSEERAAFVAADLKKTGYDVKITPPKGELLPVRNPNSFGGENRPIPATDQELALIERAIMHGKGVELSTTHKDIIARASNAQVSKLDTAAGVYRRAGAMTDKDLNRVSAFREAFRARAKETSDAAAKEMIEGKGPAGWSDAAREASAKVRAADAPVTVEKEQSYGGNKIPPRPASMGPAPVIPEKPMEKARREANAKPLMKDPAVKHLLKQGLVTREDVKTSGSMDDLKARARESATQRLKDRGFDINNGSKSIYQAVDEWVNPAGNPVQKKTSEWQVSSGAKGKKTWHAHRTTTWVEDGTPRSVTEPLTTASGKLRQFASKEAAEKATSGLRGTQNEANREAIIANRKAKAADKPVVDPIKVIEKRNETALALAEQTKATGVDAGRGAAARDLVARNEADIARLSGAAKEAGVTDLHGQMQEVFGPRKDHIPGVGNPQASYWTAKAPPTPTVADLPPGAFKGTDKEFSSLSPGMRREIARSAAKAEAAKAPEVPHQMTPQGQADRFANRMVAAGSNKSPEALKAEMPKLAPGQPSIKQKFSKKFKGGAAVLLPIAVGTAMLAASNQAKAAGADAKQQTKEAVKAGAASGAVMAGFTVGAGVAVKGLMRAGMTAVRAAPMVQGAFMAYGAISEGYHAFKEGGSAGDVAKGALKGAWDMSLPGMVVNTAKDAAGAIKERRDLNATPQVSGMQRFNKVAADYKAKAEAARSPVVAPVEPSNGDNRPRGWANAKVQAAAQAAKGRKFSGVFTDGHMQ